MQDITPVATDEPLTNATGITAVCKLRHNIVLHARFDTTIHGTGSKYAVDSAHITACFEEAVYPWSIRGPFLHLSLKTLRE
jgi:hypothetical protein